MKKSCLYLFITTLLFSLNIFAQEISIKTVPLATGNQFSFLPSKFPGIGNLSIAIDDPWLDPFVNPAKGIRIDGTYFFCSPALYQITNNNGGAKTLSLSTLYKESNWFGGVLLSVQQLELSNNSRQGIGFIPSEQTLGDQYSDNMYLFGSIGKKIPNSNTTIGASLFYANLDAIEGVELLYPRSHDIEQYGNITNMKVGIIHETEDSRLLEASLFHNRFNMTHDVAYTDFAWNEYIAGNIKLDWIEKNLDKSRTWGLHLGYVRPLDNNWRIGGILTGNWKTHPKIPNYELMNIPRDPGNSWAYNLGIGFANSDEDTTFGFEFIYEPIWSNTWADAANQLTSRSGRTIFIGEKTIENDFRFSNYIMRIGIHSNEKPFGYQLGLQLHSIRYDLDQYDYVEEFRRKQKESWIEWTISWGIMKKFQTFELRYMGKMIIGTGRPGVANRGGLRSSNFATADSNILIAPSGDLTLDNLFVFFHQISIAVPLK